MLLDAGPKRCNFMHMYVASKLEDSRYSKMGLFFCQHCTYRCSKWRNLLRHTFECHSSVPGFRFSCSLSGCKRTFKTLSAISSHINRDHTSTEEPTPSSATREEESDSEDDSDITTPIVDHFTAVLDRDSDCDTEDFQYPHDHSDSGKQSEEIIEDSSSVRLQKAAARFILSLKEQHRLTQVAVNYLVSQVKEMVACVIDDVREAVETVLVEKNLVSSNSHDIFKTFDHCYENNPFAGLETEYKQTKFYKNNFNLVVS